MNLKAVLDSVKESRDKAQTLLKDLRNLWDDEEAFVKRLLEVEDSSLLLYPTVLILIADKLQTMDNPNLYNQFSVLENLELYHINAEMCPNDISGYIELALFYDVILGNSEEALLIIEKALKINKKMSEDLATALKEVKDI